MKRFSLFLDFDDTLVETRPLIAQYLSNRYGVDLKPEDVADNNGFNYALNIRGVDVNSDEVYLDFGKNFFPSFSLQDFNLYPDAKEAILNLSEIYNLYIVTSRQKSEKNHIEEILKYNEILHCFNEEIHCVWDWKDNCFLAETKTSFVEKKRKDQVGIGFIDDSIEEVLGVMKTRCIASPALFDPKRTYTKEGIGFEIFHDWKTIEKIFS